MDLVKTIKSWISALIEIGILLLALAIIASLLAGSSVPFFGDVVGNITSLIKQLGDNGLVGLIALGVILWLFTNRD